MSILSYRPANMLKPAATLHKLAATEAQTNLSCCWSIAGFKCTRLSRSFNDPPRSDTVPRELLEETNGQL